MAMAYCRLASSPMRTSSATVKPVPVSTIDASFDGVRSGADVAQPRSASVTASASGAQ